MEVHMKHERMTRASPNALDYRVLGLAYSLQR